MQQHDIVMYYVVSDTHVVKALEKVIILSWPFVTMDAKNHDLGMSHQQGCDENSFLVRV